VKEYAPDNIRNVAIVGHQDTGKTVLTDALLFAAGAIARVGRVEDGNTTMDYTKEEIERQITIHSGVAHCEHRDVKINFIDAPGYEDFVGEVLLSLDVCDAGLVVLRADGGVEVGTDKVFGFLRDRGLPALLVVNKMDKEHADFDACVEQVREAFGGGARAFHLPIGHGDDFRGLVDLVAMKAYELARDERGTPKEIPVPSDLEARAASLRKELMESAAESDEALMEKYLETETLTDEEFARGLAAGVREGDLLPIFCAAGAHAMGGAPLLDAIVDLLPPATAGKRATAGGEAVATDPSGAPCAYVFKNVSDPHVGDMLFFRVYGGALEAGHDVHNTTRDQAERLGGLYFVRGKHRDDTTKVGAGDIGAVVKLKATKVRDTLAEKKGAKLAPTELPSPSVFSAILPAAKADEEKMGTGLHRLADEDPTFEVKVSKETRQTVISGQGEMHLEILVHRLKERYGVEVLLEKPRIPYKETITRSAEAQGRHKKQTGGRGQFGDVWLRLEPLPRGEQFEFVNGIVGGVVPGKFIPAVEKGVVATMGNGVIAGYPMVDVRVTLYDGSYHTVDSSEQAFKTAASIGFKAAVQGAGPVLLEPILNIGVKVPEEFMGDVMGDLSGRRGRIQGTETQGKFTVITAQVPQADLYRYSTHLRSMTQGRGSHTREFSHYEVVPHDQQEKIVEEAKKQREEEK